jgi:membrane-associated phospholipid phosphatase
VASAALLPFGIVYRRFLPVVLVLAALEGLSMLAFDYHFLSDVLAGMLVGILCVLLVGKLLGIPNQAAPLEENQKRLANS